jgi:hypothetical protein
VSGPSAADIDVSLQPSAVLRGRVLAGPHQFPLADARVTLIDMSGNAVGVVSTGMEGEYAFNDLDDGMYTVIARGYPPVAVDVSIDHADAMGIDLTLEHPQA